MTVKLVGIVLVSALVAGWYLWRRQSQNARTKKLAPPKYPGVAIKAASGASTCAAMQQLAGKRFLPDEAPMLPLPECDVERCSCCYVRYRDRRSEDDRREYYRNSYNALGGTERRSRQGRRASDNDDVVLS